MISVYINLSGRKNSISTNLSTALRTPVDEQSTVFPLDDRLGSASLPFTTLTRHLTHVFTMQPWAICFCNEDNRGLLCLILISILMYLKYVLFFDVRSLQNGDRALSILIVRSPDYSTGLHNTCIIVMHNKLQNTVQYNQTTFCTANQIRPLDSVILTLCHTYASLA